MTEIINEIDKISQFLTDCKKKNKSKKEIEDGLKKLISKYKNKEEKENNTKQNKKYRYTELSDYGKVKMIDSGEYDSLDDLQKGTRQIYYLDKNNDYTKYYCKMYGSFEENLLKDGSMRIFFGKNKGTYSGTFIIKDPLIPLLDGDDCRFKNHEDDKKLIINGPYKKGKFVGGLECYYETDELIYEGQIILDYLENYCFSDGEVKLPSGTKYKIMRNYAIVCSKQTNPISMVEIINFENKEDPLKWSWKEFEIWVYLNFNEDIYMNFIKNILNINVIQFINSSHPEYLSDDELEWRYQICKKLLFDFESVRKKGPEFYKSYVSYEAEKFNSEYNKKKEMNKNEKINKKKEINKNEEKNINKYKEVLYKTYIDQLILIKDGEYDQYNDDIEEILDNINKIKNGIEDLKYNCKKTEVHYLQYVADSFIQLLTGLDEEPEYNRNIESNIKTINLVKDNLKKIGYLN